MDLQDVGAVETGGASGLGAAASEMLGVAGARVTTFDVNEDAGAAQADKIDGRFSRVDIADAIAVADAIGEAEEAHGVARALVNCAGVMIGAKTIGRDHAPHPIEQFRRLIDINLVGVFNMIANFALRLGRADPLGEERGVIVNTASVASGRAGRLCRLHERDRRHDVADLAPLAIRIMTIALGIVRTPMLAGLPRDVQGSLARQMPFPSRLGLPQEYADLVRAILVNPMLNGETIRLDGAVRVVAR